MTPLVSGTQLAIDLAPCDLADVLRILREQVSGMEVWAFGSRVKHTAKPYSDLDLALISPKPLTLELMATINDAFATSDQLMPVDVVDWASASETFRQIMARDKVLVKKAMILAIKTRKP